MLERRNSETPLSEKYNIAEIMQREQKTWELKDIPPPPDKLFQVLDRANEKGYTTLEPHYFPERQFTQDSVLWSGVGIKPGGWFWSCVRLGELPKDATKLNSIWVLVDNTKIYLDSDDQQDGIAPVLQRLRNERKIKIPSLVDLVTPTSRRSISWDDLHHSVNPAIADMIGVEREMVRQPRAIEFNVLANLHYPEWRDAIQREWMEDLLEEDQRDSFRRIEGKKHLICGRSSPYEKFDSVNNWLSDKCDKGISFRPLVVFPTQK